jgi:hypothetical protein
MRVNALMFFVLVAGCSSQPAMQSAPYGPSGESRVSESNSQHSADSNDGGQTKRWRLQTKGHNYFPLLEKPIDIAALRRSESGSFVEENSDATLGESIGCWSEGMPRASRDIVVIGFERNSLRVMERGVTWRTWFVPLTLVATTLSSELTEAGGSADLIFPTDKVVENASILEILPGGKCRCANDEHEVFSAEPLIMTWYWDEAAPRQLRVMFGLNWECPWPEDRLNQGNWNVLRLKDVVVVSDSK